MSAYKDFNSTIDQKKLLDECMFVVKEQSFYMKKSFENGSLRDTLKYASNMLCELRTSLLSPKYYYELYMVIFNELQHLDSFISDKKKHKKKFIDIYESVQHAGNIIPRLYLLIIVGRNYIKNKDIKAKYILRDMTELCKGIQHPLRGLFLRYFLIQMCKDRIPDTGSEYEEAGGGNIDDAFDFLLTNFSESLKLWSRMNDKTIVLTKHQEDTLINTRKKNLKEKMDVKMLVGSILVRMSQLEGMTIPYYIEKCLPRLLTYLSNINDTLIQQYIFESIVQVFSDECHIYSLEILLHAIMKINTNLDFKSILITLLKRLRSFIESNKYKLPENIDIFNLFYSDLVIYVNNAVHNYGNAQMSNISQRSNMLGSQDAFIKNEEYRKMENNGKEPYNENLLYDNANHVKTTKNPSMGNQTLDVNREAEKKCDTTENLSSNMCGEDRINNILKMLQVIYEFLHLCIDIYNDLDYIDKIFELPLKILETVDINNEQICEQVIDIIVLPFQYLGLCVLKSQNLNIFLGLISEEHRKKLSLDIIDAVIGCKNKSIVYEDVEKVLNYISAIFHEKKKKEDVFNLENTPNYTCDKICKFFHIITNTKNIEKRYNVFMLFYKYIENCSFIVHVLPTIIFCMLNLVTQITNLGNSPSEKREDVLNDLTEDSYDNCIHEDINGESSNELMKKYQEEPEEELELDEEKATRYNMYVKNIFKFIHSTLLSIANKIPLLTFKLFLYSAVVVDNYKKFLKQYQYLNFDNLEAICYEFVTQPLIIFEEDINISSQQYDCILWAIGILCSHITLLDNENYDNIATKLTQHASKLLKKKDQCFALLHCSHLYWENQKYRNSGKVFDCLQKCLKGADTAVHSNASNVYLFVYILQKYIYYYANENIEITEDHIHYLIEVCHEYYLQPNCDKTFQQEYRQVVKDINNKKKNSKSFLKIIVDTSILMEQ